MTTAVTVTRPEIGIRMSNHRTLVEVSRIAIEVPKCPLVQSLIALVDVLTDDFSLKTQSALATTTKASTTTSSTVGPPPTLGSSLEAKVSGILSLQ